jgi:hypothetical protein
LCYKFNMDMKRISLIIIVSAFFLNAFSQNVDDALRYSQSFYGGTARFNSMGGAFVALGGDLSSISLNPAGTGVYRSSEFSITPQLQYINTKTNFNGTASDFRYNFNLNQVGLVSNFYSSGNESGLVGLNFAYSFNRTNNFNTNIIINGVSTNSSMADYWATSSQGTNFSQITGSAGIAFDVYVMDTITGSSGNYFGTVYSRYGDEPNSTYGQTIRRIITNDGSTAEHSFSVGGNYGNKFYFGATIGLTKLNYTGHYEHLESDVNNNIFDFKSFTYLDHLEANGSGYSFKLGTIYKPAEFIRLGFAVHSPIIYRIKENYYDNIASNFDNGDRYESKNETSKYSYTLTSPFRLTGGVAVQVQKYALLSADYEFIDYTMARFSNASDDYNYYEQNQEIRTILKPSSNVRLGAEFRLNMLYMRGGLGYYGKAFKKGEENEKTHTNSYSLGIGFRQQNFFFDLAYNNTANSQKYFMYRDPPYLDATTIETRKNIFTTTLGLKF